MKYISELYLSFLLFLSVFSFFVTIQKNKSFCLQGGREVDDFVKYIAEHATSELKGYDRKGKAKKSEL